MSLTVQSCIPTSITIGDGVSFRVSDPLYPAGTWTCSLLFKLASGSVKTFIGTTSGTSFLFTLDNDVTSTLSAGQAIVVPEFSDGTYRKTGTAAAVQILADPSKAVGKSYAAQQVDNLRTVIAQFNSTDKSAVNFNGQSFQRANIATYRQELVYWEAIKAKEDAQAAANLGIPAGRSRSVPIQFVNNP